MATNVFFRNYDNTYEQNLIDDLVIESISIYGVDLIYITSSLPEGTTDEILNENDLRLFDTTYDFEAYVKDKYANPNATHHYELTQSSGPQKGNGPDDYSHKIEVNSTEVGAQSVSNREYEQRLQDQKRQIKLLQPQFLGIVMQEFEKLISK